MRLSTTIDLFLPGERVPLSASLWDRIKQAFGGAEGAADGRMRLSMDATVLVSDLRDALRRLGITNAISLVVDGHVVFTDPHGRPDDFADLLIALSEHAPVFGGGFQRLRLAVEHREAGLHAVVEIAVASEHAEGEPGAVVNVGARLSDLEPRPGEDAEAYRRRIAPMAENTFLLDAHKRQFEAFVARLADALRAAFPTAAVQERAPEAKVVRPTTAPAPAPAEPTEPGYDPFARHYPNPFEGMLSGLLLGSLLSSAFRPPGLMVVHPSGAPITSAADLDAHTREVTPDAPDPGLMGGNVAGATAEEQGLWGDEGAAGDEPLGGDPAGGDGWDAGDDFGGFGDDSF